MNVVKLKHSDVDFSSESQPGFCKILSVEDDLDYQSALVNSLTTLNYDGNNVEVLTANSASEAIKQIAQNPDISVILLDVIMEQDDSGLRLVDTIREGIGNDLVRIVLLTGQPGAAPVDSIMENYDIDDYWSKSELTHDHLQTIILSNLRTWHHLKDMKQARHGMQMIVEASQRLGTKRDVLAYTQSILEEVTYLLNVRNGGIACFVSSDIGDIEKSLVIAASGDFSECLHQTLGAAVQEDFLLYAIRKAYKEHHHVLIDGYSVLFFANRELEKVCISLVKLDRQLQPNEVNLLQVLCENINVGFRNVALHSKLTELAYFDPILGIHNKNWLARELRNLKEVDRQSAKLLMLQIDEYDHTETVFGAKFGHQLIQAMYSHLRDFFTDTIDIALVARDTMAVLVYANQVYDESVLQPLIHAKLDIENAMHTVDTIVGAVDLAKLTHFEATQVISAGLSAVKHAGSNGLSYMAYDEVLESSIIERYALLQDLREAVMKDQIEVFLQPKVSLKDKQLVGFEALARWQHYSGDFIPPNEFIALAESCGLIGKLDRNIMRRSCLATKMLAEQGIKVPISVNVTGSEVIRSDYFERLIALFEELEVDQNLIELEITETQLIEEKGMISKKLESLKKKGIRINIDDFGTGYSSLAYLATLSVSTLKVDHSFVWRMENSMKDWMILRMIIDLGHVLGLNVVAEGIETKQQLEKLEQLGCHQGQGYFFAKPMPLNQVGEWVAQFHAKQGLSE